MKILCCTIFCLIILNSYNGKLVLAELDEETNTLLYEGKLYATQNNFEKFLPNNEFYNFGHGSSAEEELGEVAFWGYIMIVFCKFQIN